MIKNIDQSTLHSSMTIILNKKKVKNFPTVSLSSLLFSAQRNFAICNSFIHLLNLLIISKHNIRRSVKILSTEKENKKVIRFTRQSPSINLIIGFDFGAIRNGKQMEKSKGGFRSQFMSLRS